MSRSASFYRSARALDSDRPNRIFVGILASFLILGAWCTWAAKARVSRFEVSDSARVEIDRAATPVQSRLSGRVSAVHIGVGQEVRMGDVLVELESEAERLSLAEERTRLTALAPQLDALRAQLGAQNQGYTDERAVLSVAAAEAEAKYREGEALWRHAEAEAERSRKLFGEGLIATAEAQKAQAEAKSKQAAAENLRIATTRLEPELKVRETDREARRRQILTDIAKLEAEMASSGAAVRRLEYERERRVVRAPVGGRLAEAAVLRPGGYVSAGDRLGLIVPGGGLRVVADFPPSTAMGRIRAGQPATVRLQGFPWAQYGTVAATVSRVAGEVRDGRVRVELALAGGPSRIPLQHGLPGSVEIEVERVSPASLILRTAGQMAAQH